jgi:hypothetical protein
LTRYLNRWRVAGFAGLVSAVALALSAAPAGATKVCPPGTNNPSYCANILPIAATAGATNVKATSATLNGTSGPAVPGGDITVYQFEYGLTMSYGKTTPAGKVGSCPAGNNAPLYCSSVPAAQAVKSNISNLTPCTTYHFRIDSANPDSAGTPTGKVLGNDQKFTTAFQKPIKSLKSPQKVKAGKKFKVTVQLTTKANLQVQLLNNGKVVKNQKLGQRSGKVTVSFKAPSKKGKKYAVRAIAKLSCGKQEVTNKLEVH